MPRAALPAAIALAPCAFVLPSVGSDDALIEIQVTPAGAFLPRDGRELPVPHWTIDAATAAQVIQRFRSRHTSPVIDYEHQTLHAESNGQPAPAAAWIRDLAWRDGQGLFATVELTRRARELIAGGEYRYFSPVLRYDKNTGRVLAVEMGALTINPAIDGMQPLELRAAATFIHQETDHMNQLLAAVIAALALGAETTEDQAITALKAIPTERDALAKLRAAFGVADSATAEETLAACTAIAEAAKTGGAKPDPAKYVPVGVVDELRTELSALSAKVRNTEVDELVQPALADGRLLPAQEAWARDLGKTDIAKLSAYLDTAQPIAALAGSQTKGQAPAPGADGLTAEELAVCTATGISVEDFKKSKTTATAQAA